MQGHEHPRREHPNDRLGVKPSERGVRPGDVEDVVEARLVLRPSEEIDGADPVLDRTSHRVFEDRIARTCVDRVVAVALPARVGELHLQAAALVRLLAQRVEPVAREELRIETMLEQRGRVGGWIAHRVGAAQRFAKR